MVYQKFFLIARYGVVATTAYVVHLSIVWFASISLSSPAYTGVVTTLSFSFVSIASYFVHRYFTFNVQVAYLNSMLKYVIVVASGAFFSGLVSFIAKQHLSEWLVFWAQVSFIAFWTLISASLMKYWVFNQA